MENQQFAFNPSKIDETIAQQVKYYDDYVKMKGAETTGSNPELLATNPEELLALAQASDNPQEFLADVALSGLPSQSDVDNITDQATLDSILEGLSNNPEFDGNLANVHGMVGELIAQVQSGMISPDDAQEQLVFNILELFEEGTND